MLDGRARRWVLAVVVALLLPGLLACGAPTTPTPGTPMPTSPATAAQPTQPPTEAATRVPTETATQPPTETPTEEPTATPAAGAAGAVAQVGDRVTAEGKALTVEEVSTTNSVNEFFTPEPGNTFLVTGVSIENVSSEADRFNMFDFGVRDSQGNSYTPTVAPEPQLSSGEIVPGETVRGNVAFEVPMDAQGFILLWQPSVLGPSVRVDLGR
jgi:hypothetical protein